MLDSSDDDIDILPKVKPTSNFPIVKPILGSRTFIRETNASDPPSEEDIAPVRRARRKRPPPITVSSDEASDLQTAQQLVTPKTKQRSRLQCHIEKRQPSGESGAEISTKKLKEGLSISPQSQSSSRLAKTGPKSSHSNSPSRERRNSKGPVIGTNENEGSSSDDVVATPVRRRRSTAQIPLPPRKSDDSSASGTEDLEDEVNNLHGSDTDLRNTRTRGKQANSARDTRQQKLEELRKRRAGIREGIVEASGQNESDDANTSVSEPMHHVMRRGVDLDEYEDDFVDDDDEALGVEVDVEALRRIIPIEYTHHVNKKTIEHFKDEIEWMVHNKLNPAFNRHDDIYEVAHRKLDDEFKAYAGSKYSSSAWAAEFHAALKIRPDIYITGIPTMLEQKCDACRRANHPPKHRVTFTGKPYDRHTLEPLANDDDDDDDDTDESSSMVGHSTDEEPNFFLGR